MMLEFLTEEELFRITRYKRGRDQIEWLTERGFKAIMGRDGVPLVLRSHVEAVFSPKSALEKTKAQPNFEALRIKLRRKKGKPAQSG